MIQTHKGSEIKQMSSVELNALPRGSVYQAELVGAGKCKVPVEGTSLTQNVILELYLVEYKETK